MSSIEQSRHNIIRMSQNNISQILHGLIVKVTFFFTITKSAASSGFKNDRFFHHTMLMADLLVNVI